MLRTALACCAAAMLLLLSGSPARSVQSVAGDTNGTVDVFVRDRLTGQTTRVSVAADGAQATGNSLGESISADGRFVAFLSDAANLVPGDTNGEPDVFVRDRHSGQTTRVNLGPAGVQADGPSANAQISANGRFVVFESLATNLVPGTAVRQTNVFVHDRYAGQTTQANVSSGGAQGDLGSWWPRISADGRFVTFWSIAANLVPGDTNGAADVFVRDRLAGQTTRVSVASGAAQANSGSWAPSISGDGRFVVFESAATNLVAGDTNGHTDIFVHDRSNGQTVRASVGPSGQPNGPSITASLSGDGRVAVFRSAATNLVPDDTNGVPDVFVRDLVAGLTTRVNVAAGGAQATASGWSAWLNATGRFVVFESAAIDLVPGDTNGQPDVFVKDRSTGLIGRVSVTSGGLPSNGRSGGGSISADGRFVAFSSSASNLLDPAAP
jgi:Tol biopolymer transport system component